MQHARGDDAHHADVPKQLSFDDDEISLGIEFRADGADDFIDDAAFDFLTLAIAHVESLRDGRGFGLIAREEQAQGFLGGFQAAGGVQARGELETDLVGAQRSGALRNFFERDQAGALGRVQALKAGGNEKAIFADQGHDVGDGAEGDEIEQGAQVEFREAGKISFRGRV